MVKTLTKSNGISLVHSEKSVQVAKELYFMNMPLAKISSIADIPIHTLETYVDNEWRIEKSNHLDATMLMCKIDKTSIINEIHGLSTSIVHENLKRIKEKQSKDPNFKLTTKDLKNIGDYMVGQDKIARLESGQPTDILERQGLTREEARQLLKEDPFADIQEAEFKVLD